MALVKIPVTVKTVELADQIDGFKRRALALFAAIMGLEVLNEGMRGAVADLAFELSDELGKFSDQVHPPHRANAVAS